MYQVICRYPSTKDAIIKIMGTFIEKKNAKQFCAVEQARLGPNYKIKVKRIF